MLALIFPFRKMWYINMKAEVRWIRQSMFLIIVLLLSLSVAFLPGQTDPCQSWVSVPTQEALPTSCSTCKNRCGNLTDVGDMFSLAPSPNYCSCDNACLVYGDCCPDFHKFCEDIYLQAELLAGTYPKVQSECIRLNTWHPDSSGIDADGVALFRSNTLMVQTCNTPDVLCYNFKIYDQDVFNTFVPVTDRNTGIHYRNVLCAHCNGITDLIPWEINMQCFNPSDDLDTSGMPDPDVSDDPLESYLESNRNNGTISSADMLKKLMELLICTYYFKPANTYPSRDCLLDVVSTCNPACENTELIKKCEEPRQTYSTMVMSMDTFKNFYCAMCNNLADVMIICGQAGLPYVTSWGFNTGTFSLTVLMDYSSNGGIKVAPPSCEAGHAWFEDELECKLVECSSGYSFINNSCVSDLSIKHINATIYVHVESREHLLLDNSQYLLNIIENRTVQDLQRLSNLQQIHVRILDESEPHIKGIVWNTTLYIFIEYKENMTNTTQNGRVMKTVIRTFQSMIFELFESRNITLSVFKLTVGEVNSKWFSAEVCAGYTYTSDKYNIVSDHEVHVITSDKYYTGDEFYILDGILHVCLRDDDRQTMMVSAAFGITTITFAALSLICLAIRLVLQFMVSSYSTFPGRLQFNLVLALFFAFLLLLGTPFLIDYQVACSIGGAFKHWAFMAAFCWMNNIAFDTWSVFRSSRSTTNSEKSLAGFVLYGWFLPLIIAAVAFGLDYVNIDLTIQPRYDEGFCWISQTNALILFYIAPIALCLFANIAFYIHTSISLSKSFKNSRIVLHKNERNNHYGVYIRLFVLMGITWILGFIAPAINEDFLWYIYIILNASQGVFIFIAFVVNKKNIELIKKRFNKLQRRRMSDSQSTPGTQVTNISESDTQI